MGLEWLKNSYWLGLFTGVVLVIAMVILLALQFPLFVYRAPSVNWDIEAPTAPPLTPGAVRQPARPRVTEIVPMVARPEPLVDLDRKTSPVRGLEDFQLAPAAVDIPEGSTNSPSLFRPDF